MKIKKGMIRLPWRGCWRVVPYEICWPFGKGITLVACNAAGPIGVIKAYDATEAKEAAFATFWQDELPECGPCPDISEERFRLGKVTMNTTWLSEETLAASSFCPIREWFDKHRNI